MSILDDINNELSRIEQTKEEIRDAINDLYGFDIITNKTSFGNYSEKIRKFPCESMALDEILFIKERSRMYTLEGAFQYYQGTELDLSGLNTFNICNTERMFSACYNLTTLDIRDFDLTNCTEYTSMFSGCRSLRTLRLDNCNNNTIRKIVGLLPENRGTIYCKRSEAEGIKPGYWTFSYID